MEWVQIMTRWVWGCLTSPNRGGNEQMGQKGDVSPSTHENFHISFPSETKQERPRGLRRSKHAGFSQQIDGPQNCFG